MRSISGRSLPLLVAVLIAVGVAPGLVLRAHRAIHAASPRDTALTNAAGVDAVFSRWTSSTPGCAVGVSRDGEVVLEKGYGMADLEHDVPNTGQTVFEAGSVSKQFTAAA